MLFASIPEPPKEHKSQRLMAYSRQVGSDTPRHSNNDTHPRIFPLPSQVGSRKFGSLVEEPWFKSIEFKVRVCLGI